MNEEAAQQQEIKGQEQYIDCIPTFNANWLFHSLLFCPWYNCNVTQRTQYQHSLHLWWLFPLGDTCHSIIVIWTILIISVFYPLSPCSWCSHIWVLGSLLLIVIASCCWCSSSSIVSISTIPTLSSASISRSILTTISTVPSIPAISTILLLLLPSIPPTTIWVGSKWIPTIHNL